MKRRDLERHLRANGAVIVDEGANHTKWRGPDGGRSVVPRQGPCSRPNMVWMVMVIGVLVVLVGVVIGWWTVSGSGIHVRTYRDKDSGGESREYGESPLDSPWTMNEWSRGTSSRSRRRHRR